MIDLSTWSKAWALLDARERRNALVVLAVSVIAALASAVMVGSVMPFLTVLVQPARIESGPALARAHATFGFTSDYAFLVALGLVSLGVIVLASLVQILRTHVVSRFTLMRMHTLSQRLLAAYLRQSCAFFLDRHSGEMGTRIPGESRLVVDRFFRPAARVVASGFTVPAIVALLLWLNVVVAVLAFGLPGGTCAATFVRSRRRLNRLGGLRAEAGRSRYRVAGEALGGIEGIKLSGSEIACLDRFAAPSPPACPPRWPASPRRRPTCRGSGPTPRPLRSVTTAAPEPPMSSPPTACSTPSSARASPWGTAPSWAHFTARQRFKYRHLAKWWYPWFYFLFAYGVKRGFPDGAAGFHHAFYKAWYFQTIRLLIREDAAAPR